MKITVIGGGSFFFTRQILKRINSSTILHGVHLELVDTNPTVAAKIGTYAGKYVNETGNKFTVHSTTDRREALPGSDYVVLTFSPNNIHSRGVGAHICQNYGIREISGDTAGPAAVIRIIRDVPLVLDVARDVEALAPKALVISYTNPTNVVTAALKRYTKLKSIGLCDGPHLPYFAPKILGFLGVEPTKENRDGLTLHMGGINHFGWIDGVTLHGKNVWKEFKSGMIAMAEKMRNERPILQAEAELLQVMNAWPTCMYHGAEYMRYFQGRGRYPARDYVIDAWSLAFRQRMVREFWRNVDAYNAGTMDRAKAFKDRLDDGEMIGDVIESIEGDLNQRFPINVVNEGRISNLPNECIVELFGTLGKDGDKVPAYGALPRGPLGMVQAVVDQQELAIEAAMTGDLDLLVRAVACDPLVMSLHDARDITRELMAAEAEYLDPKWDRYWVSWNPIYIKGRGWE
jgi:alpha-galactosidase